MSLRLLIKPKFIIAAVTTTWIATSCGEPVRLTGTSAAAARVVSLRLGSVPVGPLDVGTGFRIGVTALDAQGIEVTGILPTWFSTDSSVAQVDPSGLVSARSMGRANVGVIVGSATTNTQVTVAGSVVSLAITPSFPRLKVGETVQFVASAKDAMGTTVTTHPITWRSSDLATGVVTTTGLLTAAFGGTSSRNVTITAICDGVSASTSATVFPRVSSISLFPSSVSMLSGNTAQLSVTATDYLGRQVTGLATQWSSADVTVATVNSLGLVTGISGGTSSRLTTISATIGEQTATIFVTVIKR